MIRLDKLTIKAQEALQSAQEMAQKLNHQEVDCEHMLSALIEQPDGLVRPLLEKLGANPDAILHGLDNGLKGRPQVHGIDSTQIYLSKALRTALDAAFAQADKLKDQFVSTEHILLGIAETTNLLKAKGVTGPTILKALRELRGNTQVTDQNPEDKYQALLKYGRDLTEEARRGKLIRSLAAIPRFVASCRCSHGERRTTPFSSAIPAWVRRPSPRVWRGESSAATCRKA